MNDDDLLMPRTPAGNDRLRADLLAITTRRIRFQRRMRVAKRLGICALCFAAGLALTFLRPKAEPEVVYIVHEQPPPVPKIELPPPQPPRRASAAELELQAEELQVKADSARRFREAGDRYLQDYADYSAALRCYRNFLDEADPADLVVNREDTWLLTSLKRAREQENSQ